MKIRTGCDIVEIKRFKELDEKVLNKIFNKGERAKKKAENLAGLFAVKESCKKVFGNLEWHDIEVKKGKGGKPFLVIHGKAKDIKDCDVSISHDGNYAIAFVVFLLNEESENGD
tara:strand:- start:1670 stop:2011 length:342 start_codon:yes stop_codon:yes gene_type:complete